MSSEEVEKRVRDERGRLLPGHTANPGGRPKGLSRFIRESTREGAELAEFMLAIFRNDKKAAGLGSRDVIRARDRIDAATWLADRGFGKPTQPLSGDEDMPALRIVIPGLDLDSTKPSTG